MNKIEEASASIRLWFRLLGIIWLLSAEILPAIYPTMVGTEVSTMSLSEVLAAQMIHV